MVPDNGICFGELKRTKASVMWEDLQTIKHNIYLVSLNFMRFNSAQLATLDYFEWEYIARWQEKYKSKTPFDRFCNHLKVKPPFTDSVIIYDHYF